MDNRFANPFGLTEAEAIALLDTPLENLEDKSERYIAASFLRNCPSEASIHSLIAAVQNDSPELDNQIVRRKAIDSLGQLRAVNALPVIRTCLADSDRFTVESAVWAIGEIGTRHEDILEDIAHLLEREGQIYRVIIRTLAKLKYVPALERIQTFITAPELYVASAALSAICQLSRDYAGITKVVEWLQHEKASVRRAAIQDLIDARYFPAIPQISRSPVSVTFRLRGIRLLAEAGILSGDLAFAEVEPYLDLVIQDRPDSLELVHEYDETPSLEFAIQELYQTEFGRCYLATQTIIDVYSDSAGPALMATFADKARGDYGAHYNVVKLLGWLQYEPGFDLLVEALHNPAPQFQKSRAGAAISLGCMGDARAIPHLQMSWQSQIFDLQYACLLALKQLGASVTDVTSSGPHRLIQAKLASLASVTSEAE